MTQVSVKTILLAVNWLTGCDWRFCHSAV